MIFFRTTFSNKHMPDIPALHKVKDLLADGQTEAAVDLLLEIAGTADEAHFTAALLLKNRLETLQQKVIEGVVSQSEENLEWARICKGILGLSAQISRGEKPLSPEELFPSKKSIPRFPVKILWAIPVLIILGLAAPKFLKKKLPPVDKKENKIERVSYAGQVVRPNNAPAPDVKLVFKKGGFQREVYTDKEGNFTIDLPQSFSNINLEIYYKNKIVMPVRNIAVDRDIFKTLKIPE